MKLGVIFLAVFQSFWCLELGLLTLYFYPIKVVLFWSILFCAASSIAGFIFFNFGAEKLRNLLEKWPVVKNWLIKVSSENAAWLKHFRRYPYLGLYFGGMIPIIGIPLQRILQLKYGDRALLFGHITKILIYIYIFHPLYI